jgi:hypothetical protein
MVTTYTQLTVLQHMEELCMQPVERSRTAIALGLPVLPRLLWLLRRPQAPAGGLRLTLPLQVDQSYG